MITDRRRRNDDGSIIWIYGLAPDRGGGIWGGELPQGDPGQAGDKERRADPVFFSQCKGRESGQQEERQEI